MTETEQEALSVRYLCPRIIRAGDIVFLMQDGFPPIEITSLDQVPQASEVAYKHDATREEHRRAPKKQIDLFALGLLKKEPSNEQG